MNPLTIVMIIIIILAILAIIYIFNFNKLQFYRTRIEKSENIIDDALRKKYDKICEMNITIKKEFPKKDYLKEYIDLKDKRLTNYFTDRKLVEAMNVIKELVDDNDTINTKEMREKIREIDKIDEELTSGKNYYNKNNTELNEIIRKFPSNIVAKIHHFKIKPYFDGKNMQDAVLDDFKL